MKEAKFVVMDPVFFKGFGDKNLGLATSISSFQVSYRETILMQQETDDGQKSCFEMEEIIGR